MPRAKVRTRAVDDPIAPARLPSRDGLIDLALRSGARVRATSLWSSACRASSAAWISVRRLFSLGSIFFSPRLPSPLMATLRLAGSPRIGRKHGNLNAPGRFGGKAALCMEGVSPGGSRDTAWGMSEENVEIVRRLWADLETENLEASIHLLDEGVEIWNAPQFPVTGPYRGHDGVRQWAAEQWEVLSGLHHEIEEIIEAPDGETLVSVQRTQGRMRHTDMKTNVQWATTWTIRDGKVLRAYGYLTRAEALETAGLRE
jgi:ketosteroid isomerase-like protein